MAGRVGLLKGVQIMPVWRGQTERMLFVKGAFVSGTSKATTLTKSSGKQVRSVSQMGFEQWKLMLDLGLTKSGASMADILIDDDWITDDDLRGWHDTNLSIEDTILEITQRIEGSKSVDAVSDDDG